MSIVIDGRPHRTLVEHHPHKLRWRCVVQRRCVVHHHFVTWDYVRRFRWRKTPAQAAEQELGWILKHRTERFT